MINSSDQYRPADQPLRVLEAFAKSAGIAFDRLLAARTLGEAERAAPGNDGLTWSQRLVETGDSVNLRVRSMECTISEALTLVSQGIPTATYLEHPGGGLEWVLLTEIRSRRVRRASVEAGGSDQWLTVRQLHQLLGVSDKSEMRRWVVGQPALACDSQPADSLSKPRGPVSPLARLFLLLRPERKDLWVILIFSIITGILALASPIAVEALVNTVAFGRYLQPIIVLALLLFTFLAFAAAMRGLLAYVAEILQRRLFVRVVQDLAYRLPRVRQTSLDNHHGPELVNRFFDVVTVQKAASSLLLDGLSLVLQTMVGMAVLAFYHPFLLGFDVLLLLMMAFVTFGLGFGAVKTAIKESKAKYAVGAWLEELTRNPTAFKLNGGMRLGLEKSDQLAVDYLEARRGHFRILIRQILFALGLQAVAATVLLGLGGWLVIQGQLTLGQLVAAELIVMMIVGSFAKIGKHLESYYDLLAAVDKLGQLFDLTVESHDKLFHLREGMPASVKVRQLAYKYGSGNVLSNLTMELQPGEHVALVGDAGAGKSTLIDLLCGLRQPTAGHVEIDGIDLRELRPDSLREHMGVARSLEVFHGTIDENVHLGRPRISAGDVREALDVVGLLDEILRLPDGLNSVLQSTGAPLSASQATRLMVARAIVGRPRLLLIDGTLDALTDETSEAVLARLMDSSASWTSVICTGHLSTARACDRSVRLTNHGIETLNSK